jgi:glycosyltransferase involved in cell wall biosynthesis
MLWKALWSFIIWKPNLCYIAITAKGPAFYKDALFVTLSKLFGIKLLYHFHNKGVSTRQDKLLDNLLYRFVFRNAHVILLSKYLYADIQKYVKEEQVHYCPNGIPVVEVPIKEGKNGQEVEILYLSNLIESKGVFVLLDALEILQIKSLNFHCTFVGGWGDITEELFDTYVQKTGLNKKVIYAGVQYEQKKNAYFKMADIFVHPTYNDCFPLVILEAMQYSLPIISTIEGGIRDIVEDCTTGFLIQQRNVEALADKLEILIRDKELRLQMGKAGRSRFEREFTLTNFEKRITSILTLQVSSFL